MIIYVPEGCSARTYPLSSIGLYAEAIQQEIDNAAPDPQVLLIYLLVIKMYVKVFLEYAILKRYLEKGSNKFSYKGNNR